AGIAGTPGSDPASKVLNSTLNTAASFQAGGTVHFTYLDNPHTNGGTQNFTIQDCVVTYPAGFFSARDFDPSTGVLINAAYSKAVLVKGGTQIDGASLSGISSSVGNIYYAWKAPADLAADTWVCFFARDIRNNHGGSGNRKVPPTCYQVTGTTTTTSSSTTSSSTTSTTRPTDLTPGIFVGYADELHGVTFTPSPWQGDQGVVYLGCTNGSVECGDLDGGAIRIDNPATNGPLTLVNAFVDVGPCHFHPWDTMLGQSAGPGGTFVLTQTGTLGAPQAPPCDGRVDPTLRPLTNFDTSEGPFDTATPPFSNCDPTRVAAPVITLVFNGFTLTVTDSAKVLTTGGVDRFACVGQDEAAPWTAVASADVVRT
ncbi:MAG: hypothetical protein ABIS47_09305, partial [Acidimicrobiales bacterium]